MAEKPTRAQRQLYKKLHDPVYPVPKGRKSLTAQNNDLREQNGHLMELVTTMQQQLEDAQKHLNDYANVGQYMLRYKQLAKDFEEVVTALVQMVQSSAHVQDLD